MTATIFSILSALAINTAAAPAHHPCTDYIMAGESCEVVSFEPTVIEASDTVTCLEVDDQAACTWFEFKEPMVIVVDA